MFRFFFPMRSPDGDGGAPPAQEFELGAGGEILIFDPAAAPPAAPDPAPAPQPQPQPVIQLRPEDLAGWIGQPQQPQQQPQPTGFDIKPYVLEDQTIDVDGLGSGINAFVQRSIDEGISKAMQTISQQLGTPVHAMQADNEATSLAQQHGLDADARAIVAQHLRTLPAGAIAQLDESAKLLLVNAAENMARRKNATVPDNAAPGGGRVPSGRAVLSPSIQDPHGLGWEGYCRITGKDPRDRATINEAIRSGVLVVNG